MLSRKARLRSVAVWSLLLSGCSTHPVVNLLDYFKPGRIKPGVGAPHGGVCLPQGGPVVRPQVPAPPPGPILPPALPPAQPPGPVETPPPAPPGLGAPVVPPDVPPTRPF